MLLELLADIGILAGGFAGGILLPRLGKNTKPIGVPPDGIYDWFWSKDHNAFYCPKCGDISNKAGNQPPHCECEVYYQEHFHFQCNACKVKLIMKTADNSKRK